MSQPMPPQGPNQPPYGSGPPAPTTAKEAQARARGAKAEAKALRPWYQKKRFIIPLVLVALIALSQAIGGGNDPGTTAGLPAASQTSTSQAPAASKAPASEEPSDTLTAEQRNAVGAAQSYLNTSAFSRKGLIQQLSSDAGDGYSKKDATIAVDSLDIDYNEQAVKAAKAYLSSGNFSRKGLVEQLESSAGDGFTHAQAEYGAENAQ